MTSKQIVSIFLFIFLSVSLVFVYILKSKTSTPNQPVLSPTPTSVALSTWTDPSGFSFQYPSASKIDSHPEDTKHYANLTVTFPSSDTAQITMADNTFKNLDTWVGQNSAIDTTLGGQVAKKIIKDGITTIACIDNEVLVTISGKDIYQITNSWNFIYPTASPKKTSAPVTTDSTDDVLEAE